MKKSKYNIFYKNQNVSDKIVFYNTLSNALAIIDESHYDLYQDYVNNNIELETEFLENLISGGFIIDDITNEVEKLKNDFFTLKNNKDILQITIAPTLLCNFKCPYCFELEHQNNIFMSEVTQEKILEIINKNIKDIKELVIIWYGGEPLLAIDILEKMSTSMFELCDDNNVEYKASIVTNGYLLNHEVATTLKKSRVKAVQITLDGLEPTHNETRPLKNGEGTFNKIIENIKNHSNLFDDFKIRINGVRGKEDEYIQLIDYLLPDIKKNNISISMAKTEEVIKSEKNINYFSIKDYSEYLIDFDIKLLDKGVIESIDCIIPTKINSPCNACVDNSFVIDSEGYLYKCWDFVGDKKNSHANITNIMNNEGIDMNNRFIRYSPFNDSECIECIYLPICMGGCPKLAIENKKDCCTHKFAINKLFDYILQQLNEEDK